MPPAAAPAIEPVAADDRAAMDAWFALVVRCDAHDTPQLPAPSPRSHASRFSWPGCAHRAWIVRDGPEVVAAADVTLPLHDNLHHGFAHVLVAPGHRRRGLGTLLLAHVAADARAAGRTRLAIGTRDALDASGPGSGFLRSVTGARLGQVEIRRRLVLPPADPRRLRRLAASAGRAAREYRLVRWTGPTPPQWRADLAVLIARMSTDPPQGDLTFDPQVWDAARVRERDEAVSAAGLATAVTAAVAPDGHLAAYTEALVDEGAPVAYQGDTIVTPAHRGRRLGLSVKLANLELLVERHPTARAIDTWNADDNRWMIAINDAIGFVPISRVADWELDLLELQAAQAGTTRAISAAASGP